MQNSSGSIIVGIVSVSVCLSILVFMISEIKRGVRYRRKDLFPAIFVITFIGAAVLWHAYIKPSIMSLWNTQNGRRENIPNGLPPAVEVKKMSASIDTRARKKIAKMIGDIVDSAEKGSLSISIGIDFYDEQPLRDAVMKIIKDQGYHVVYVPDSSRDFLYLWRIEISWAQADHATFKTAE
jgi:hypothetical protein